MRALLLVTLSVVAIYSGYVYFSEDSAITSSEISPASMTSEAPSISTLPVNQDTPVTSGATPVRLEDVPTARKESFDKAFDYFKNRIEFLEKCFQRRCKLDNSTSHSYEHAVYLEVEKTLDTLQDWQLRHNVQDRRLSQMMTKFLAYEKSEIKMGALEILSTQAKDERVVPHILKNVIDQAYPKPIGPAIRELSRYKNSKYQQKIDSSMIEALTHGSIFSAIEIAQNIEPLLTASNRPRFESALEELATQPLSRGIHQALSSSLAR